MYFLQWFVYGCIVDLVIREGVCSSYDCLHSMYDTNQTWLTVADARSVGGHSIYFPNGSMISYDLHGTVLQKGTFKVYDGTDYCLEIETYSYPPFARNSCQTYEIITDDKGHEFYIGCAIIGDNECEPLTNCDPSWPNWYSARVTGTAIF